MARESHLIQTCGIAGREAVIYPHLISILQDFSLLVNSSGNGKLEVIGPLLGILYDVDLDDYLRLRFHNLLNVISIHFKILISNSIIRKTGLLV